VIVLTHPTGNANVRAILRALDEEGLLARFVTTLAWSKSSHPYLSDHIRGRLRRNYELSEEKIDIHPLREVVRLLAGPLHADWLTAHETGWASLDNVFRDLDAHAARCLNAGSYGDGVGGVYAYEDSAEQLFKVARELGLRRVYELPIAYWETAQRLLREEGQRSPEWEPTLGGTRDSEEKLARKTRELELSELVICPSEFVLESLPKDAKANKKCLVAPFGSPEIGSLPQMKPRVSERLRVLFAGAMTQRKGLADLFAAIKLVNSPQVQLIVMGSPIQPLEWYQERSPSFVYEPPRPHRDFLELMRSCDLLVLPSIVEGRALVQQEAMACGLPVIATRNAGADDLIVDGKTGFLVPIRSPEAIAEKLSWFLENREAIAGMGIAAQARAREFTWLSYGKTVVTAIRQLISNEVPQ
jgi:glycosyltransferase involved in cell wall biosynthesis